MKSERDKLLETQEMLFEICKSIISAKNHDYGRNHNEPFSNFDSAVVLGIDPRKGILIRTLDKISRLNSFVDHGDFAVKDESMIDTVADAINYLTIFLAYTNSKKEKQNNDDGKLA